MQEPLETPSNSDKFTPFEPGHKPDSVKGSSNNPQNLPGKPAAARAHNLNELTLPPCTEILPNSAVSTSIGQIAKIEAKAESLVKDPANTKPRENKVWKFAKSLFDTEILFASGDLAVALITSQAIGIISNAATVAFALGATTYTVLTSKKAPALGFYSMAAVSALTSFSISINLLNSVGKTPELLFSFGAFVSWTFANLLAGFKKSSDKKGKGNALSNHQLWFCVGSLCATQAAPAAAVFLIAGLTQALRSKRNTESAQNWAQFIDKHLTPSRCRFVAYSVSALTAAQCNPRYILPYVLWMLGNLAFDKGAANSTLIKDYKNLRSKLLGDESP